MVVVTPTPSQVEDLTPILAKMVARNTGNSDQATVNELSKSIAELVLGDQTEINVGVRRLLEAIRAMDLDLVKYILNEMGVDPNVQLPDRNYPLHLCTKLRENACMMLMALSSSPNHKLNLDAQDGEGNTALHFATAMVQPEVIAHLLKEKANPNIANSLGDTPLHVACKIRAPEVARELLKDARTDASKKNKAGKSANQVAETPELMTLFLDHTLRDKKHLGELEIALSWTDFNDLDLHVVCPHDEEIYFVHKQSACRGTLDVDMNAQHPFSEQPAEHIYWSDPPHGTYKIYVNHYALHTSPPKLESTFLVEISNHNRLVWQYSGRISHKSTRQLVKTFSYPWNAKTEGRQSTSPMSSSRPLTNITYNNSSSNNNSDGFGKFCQVM